MAEIIIMPKLGFNMSEGKLVTWYKKEGESVRKGEPLFAIETDKTVMDIEATGDGVVRKLLAAEGDSMPVTLPIAIVGGADEDISAALAEVGAAGAASSEASEAPAAQAAPQADSAPQAASAGSIAKADGTLKISPRARRVAAEKGLSLEGLSIQGTGFDGGVCEKDILNYIEAHGTGSVRATPLAKAMAEKEGLDLASMSGSGDRGKITKADVQGAMAGAAQAVAGADAGATSAADYKVSEDGKYILEEVPYSGIRKVIGERLAQSKFTAPHLYFTQKVNLEKLLELRKEVNGAQEQKTSVTDFIARAVIMSLVKYPDMNSSLIDGKIVKYKTVNLGIAVAAPNGLIVPNLKHSENMNVVGLAKESSRLFAKAREGKLSMAEYTGGTFTISNLGMFGIENFTAIINPPEVGILAVSATKDEVVVVEDASGAKTMAIKPMMNIQLTVDHRVIDGLLAAQFIGEIKKYLENPISLLV